MDRQQLKNLLEAAPFFLLAALARTLPRVPALKLGRLLGRYSRFILPGRRRLAADNLRHAYPDKDEEWIEQQVELVFEHLGISAMEMLRIDQFDAKQDIERYFTFEGLEHLQQLKQNNTGAFILSGHIGFWEVGTFFMPQMGYNIDFVAKTIRNPYVDNFFRRQREAAGGKCIDSRHGARRIIRSLNEGRIVCVLLDQHVSKKRAVVVNFFDRPAFATPIIAQIAMRGNTPVVPVFVYRNPDFSYRVVVEEPVYLDKHTGDDAITAHTQRLTDILENAVRRQPDQWFWVHKRWRRSAMRQ